MSHSLEAVPAVADVNQSEASPTAAANVVSQTVTNAELDALENVDFLLEEIENKIAPLALA